MAKTKTHKSKINKWRNTMAIHRKSALATSIFVALSASSLVGMNQVVAQETAVQESDVEIISISRKRPESLQEVPIAVTAISEKMIESAGIERPGDFIGLIPNVTMVDAANVGDTQVTIRGIVSTRDAEGTFAYVVDGVLMTNPNSFNEELLDVSQIEVLKGPQGALYGRNAVSGAILVTTKMPADELEGRVTLGIGNNNSQ
ncbi:MAG: iron complex outermembrane receptor protein, partial [Paraglaciecola sp.]